MPLPLDLEMAFRKGITKEVHMENGDVKTPPEGANWLILYGCFHHVTGTDTYIYVEKTDIPINSTSNNLLFLAIIPSATANGYYNIFRTEAGTSIPQWQPVILESNNKQQLKLLGDTSVRCQITVLEWYPRQ